MNDYYSNFQGPTQFQAIIELSSQTGYEKNPNWLEEYISQCIAEEYIKYDSLGSYTGWNVSVKPILLKKIKHKIEVHEKSKKLLRKMFYNFQVYGIFLKIYKDIHFKPNGSYMKSIMIQYKNIFQ